MSESAIWIDFVNGRFNDLEEAIKSLESKIDRMNKFLMKKEEGKEQTSAVTLYRKKKRVHLGSIDIPDPPKGKKWATMEATDGEEGVHFVLKLGVVEDEGVE